MSIKRWLPFLLLLTILGGGVYWLVLDEDHVDEVNSSLGASDELTQLFNAIDSLNLNPSNAFGGAKALLDSVLTSNLDPIQKDQLTEKLGKKSVNLFDQRFKAWESSGFVSVPPETEYKELRLFVLNRLELQTDSKQDLQQNFPVYAQAFVLFKLYFQPGSPDELNVRLNRMRKRPYKPQRYVDLLTDFNSHTGQLNELSPVRRAVNQIEWQRQCHELVDQQYRKLEDSSIPDTDNYNKNELPPNLNVQKSFKCAVRTYGISDFDYYYKQGRDLTFWKQAIW